MTTITDFDSQLLELDFSTLITVQARVNELVQQRRAEAMERLQKEAELLGATVQDSNGKKTRGRKPKVKRDE